MHDFKSFQLHRDLLLMGLVILTLNRPTFSQTPFIDDFSAGLSGWTNVEGEQAIVSTPIHSGADAVKFHGGGAQPNGCHSSMYRTGFSASIGEYSAWVNQQNNAAGLGIFIQVQPGASSSPYFRDGYHLRAHAADAQAPPTFSFDRYQDGGGGYNLGSLTPTFLKNEWVKIFVRRLPGNGFVFGYDRAGFRDSMIVSDPNPPISPDGAFYLWSCSDGPATANFFDDVAFGTVANHDNSEFAGSRCFNGTNHYISVPNSVSLDLGNNYTIEAWINMTELPSIPEYAIVSKWQGTGSGGYMFGITGAGDPGKLILNAGTGVSAISTQVVPAGQWHHVATTYDGVAITFFIDGIPEIPISAPGGSSSNSSALAIGKNIHNNTDLSVSPYFFKGQLDEVRISNSVRTASEFCLTAPCGTDANTIALWQMDDPSGMAVADASANLNNGTAIGQLCPGCCVLAGDADHGGDVNIGDALSIIDYIFGGTVPDPPCLAEADADGGGDVNIGDALVIIDYIFGGPQPDPICGP